MSRFKLEQINRKFVLAALAVLASLGIVWGFTVYNETRAVLAANVTKDATFTILVPKDTAKYPVLDEGVVRNSDSKVVSYATVISNRKVTINQQAEPDTFNEPGAQADLYQKLLDKMRQYKDLETQSGTVTLTKPEELNGGQAAVLKSGDALLFAQPVGNLNDAEWKAFFDALRPN